MAMFIIAKLHYITIVFEETLRMVAQETWENKCCRCEGDVKVNLFPGRRACHVTCGPCMYPDDWGKCASCEIVTHCAYALDYLRSLKPNGLKKGCYFEGQLTGEENLYQTMNFVNGQQRLARTVGEKEYLENLKKANARSPCLKK
jgi:hypothetical protein